MRDGTVSETGSSCRAYTSKVSRFLRTQRSQATTRLAWRSPIIAVAERISSFWYMRLFDWGRIPSRRGSNLELARSQAWTTCWSRVGRSRNAPAGRQPAVLSSGVIAHLRGTDWRGASVRLNWRSQSALPPGVRGEIEVLTSAPTCNTIYAENERQRLPLA